MTVLFFFALLGLLLAAAALLFGTSLLARAFIKPAFSVGAPIVYRQEEVSTRPTADARDIRPAARGEYYYDSVINYLRVIEVLADGRIIAVARDNQRRCFRLTTPRCAKPASTSDSSTASVSRRFDRELRRRAFDLWLRFASPR